MGRRYAAVFDTGDRVLWQGKVVTVERPYQHKAANLDGKKVEHTRYIIRDFDGKRYDVSYRSVAPYFPADNPFGDDPEYERFVQARWAETMRDFDAMEVVN